jgi:hypothetical protein
MAGGAFHWLEGIIHLMPDEAEFRDRMIKLAQRVGQRREITPAMIRMTLITAEDITDAAVQPLAIEDL